MRVNGRARRWRMRVREWMLVGWSGLALTALAQFGFFQKVQPRTELQVTARLEPRQVVVGQPCRVVLEFELESGVAPESLQVGGLPTSRSSRTTRSSCLRSAAGP